MRARNIDKSVLDATREEYEMIDSDLVECDAEQDNTVMDTDAQEDLISDFRIKMMTSNKKYIKMLQIMIVSYILIILIVHPGKLKNKRNKTLSVQSSCISLLYLTGKYNTTKKQAMVFIIINSLLIGFLILKSFVSVENWKERLVVQIVYALPPLIFCSISQLFYYWSLDLEKNISKLIKQKYKYKTN